MPLSTTLVAKELLMCGLKNLPIVGPAIDFIAGVHSRHQALAVEGQLASIEATMTRMDMQVRDTVAKEIRNVLANLSQPNLSGLKLTEEIRELQGIRTYKWEPAFSTFFN